MGFIINSYRFTTLGSSALDIDSYSADSPFLLFSLRKLSSSYSGNCIRLRRSSDNAESDFGFTGGVGSWVDSAAIASWGGASTLYVVTWYNQAGTYDLTQSVAAGQPTLVSTTAFGDSPYYIQFNGSSSRLNYDNAVSNVFSASEFTSYMIYNAQSTGFSVLAAVHGGTPAAGTGIHFRTQHYGTNKRLYMDSTNLTSAVSTSLNTKIQAIDYLTATTAGTLGYEIYNGTTTNTNSIGSINANANDSITLGAAGDLPSNPMNVRVLEWIYFDKYQAAGDITDIKNDQRTIFAI